MPHKTLIIAEAGVNHNGDIAIAKQLIDVAAEAGADFVKFQTFKAEKLISKAAKKAAYQIKNTHNSQESQLEMVKKYELDEATHLLLMAHCKQKGIGFLSTAFDLESIDLLHKLTIPLFKIPSGEITNLPYLKKIALLQVPIVLSTGMCTLGEVETAIQVLENHQVKRENITVLHCNTQYPTPMCDVNLQAMCSMAQALKVKVGYSDHTLGIEIPIAAVALGAVCIEKHFTLNRNMPGPDHKASLEPKELKDMVAAIRNIELAMGDGIKKPSESEKPNRPIARKSIHVNQNLPAQHIIQANNLIMKRPGDGISPMLMQQVIGKRLTKMVSEDYKLQWQDLV